MVHRLKVSGFMLLLAVLLSACNTDNSSSNREGASSDDNNNAVNAEADNEEDGIPEDEELFQILTDSMDAINRKDIEAFRSLVHQDSPAYQDSMEVLESIQDMDTEGNITEMSIEEKNEESITIYVEQEMAFLDGIGQNNQSKVIYELRPEDDEWKIYGTETLDTTFVDEEGNEIDDAYAEMEYSGQDIDQLDGEYADAIKKLDFSSVNEALTVAYYMEEIDYAIADIMIGNDPLEQLTVEVLVDMKDYLTIEEYMDQWMSTAEEFGSIEITILEEEENNIIFTSAMTETTPEFAEQFQVSKVYLDGEDIYTIDYTQANVSEIDEDEIDRRVQILKEIK